MKGLRIFLIRLAGVLPLLALAGCIEGVTTPATGARDFIVVSDFTLPEGAVHLDRSFGFSLHRGSPGVPQQQRAASIGRAVGFLVTDTITERLRAQGYDAASTTDPAPQPGSRALLVTGAFRTIDEGRRRHVGDENSAVIVEIQIKAREPDGNQHQVMSFALDSRTAPRVAAATRHETGVDADATRIGAEIARVVADVARRNNWASGVR